MAARTIPLKADWDYQPRLGDDRGHHAVRAGAGAALADFIERRAEGALLVVGHRGSGKTSAVIAAANRAAKGKGLRKAVVPIMIKATSIDKAGAEGHKALLQSLIWALHRKAEEMEVDKDLRRRAKDLYLNATASIKSDEVSRKEMHTFALGTYPVAAAASTGLSLAVLALSGVIELGLAVAPAVLAPLVAKLAWDRRTRRSSTHRYKRVYGFADMQHDFEGLLREYSASYRIVFILDEFDKDDDFAAMIRPLKMLFNQGDAAYVVITSPEKAKDLMKKREVNYTLFSEILFVNRPLFREMEEFVDDVVDAEGRESISDADYDDFRCCMRYKSQTDFFDLYGALRDRRAGVDEAGRPLVTVSLNEQEVTEANLQRSIEYVYDRKAYGEPSMQMVNDGMLDALYETAAKAEGLHGSTITVDGELTFANEGPTVYSTPRAASASRDLVSLLYRQGYLTKTLEGPFRIAGRLAKFDPAGIFVEEENAFVAAYDATVGALADFANVHSRFVDGHGAPFRRGSLDSRLDEMIRVATSIEPIYIPEDARVCRAQLRLTSRPILDPEKLQVSTDAAKDVLNELRTKSVDLLSRVLEHSGFPATILNEQIQPGLAALDFAEGQPLRNAVYRQRDDGEGVTVAVLQVPDASIVSKIRDRVDSLPRHLWEIYVVLVGDVEPVGLMDIAIPIGLNRGASRKREGAGARDMAKNHSTFVLAVASPPNVKTARAVVSAVKLIAARAGLGRKEDFERFWFALHRAAGATVGPPSSRPYSRAAGGGTARRRTETARNGRPAGASQGGASQ